MKKKITKTVVKETHTQNKLSSAISIPISLFVSLLLTPVVAFIVLITVIARLIVSLYLRILYGNKLKLIDSMDSFQVFDKPNNTLETYTFLVLEGKADITKILKAVTERLLNNENNIYEKLKCKVVKKCGYYCWEDTMGKNQFNIENHVKIAQGNLNSESVTNSLNKNSHLSNLNWTESQVLEKLGEMYNIPLSIDLPRWEMVIFPNFIYPNCTDINIEGKSHYAIILRVHHSLCDGISSYLLLSHGLADKSTIPVTCAIDPFKSLNIPLYIKMLKYFKLWMLWPKLLLENVGTQIEKNCFHGPELTGPKIVGYTKLIDMESLKNIRLNLKTSTVSVLNAAVGGSFLQLANDNGLIPPERFTAVTSIPMLPYPNLRPQNRFSGAFFPLDVGSTKDRSERVFKTHKTLKGIIESPLILMNSLLLRFIGNLPAGMSQNMTDSRELSVLTSNIPGPNKHVYFFGGDRLVDVSGWLPIKNKTGFGVCFVSYCGRIRASIVSDEAVSSTNDVKILIKALENEISMMEDNLKTNEESV